MAEGRKKPEQILQLEPANELVFKGPFKDVVATTLTLKNPTDKAVTFKVKTTAPRHYCVKPNCGTVKARDKVIVDVMLQPFDHSSTDNKRHKFMVQTMVVPDGVQDVESLWRVAEPSSIMDSKLKCVFQIPPESQPSEGNTGSTSKSSEQGSVPSPTPAQSPAPAFTSPSAKTPSSNLGASPTVDSAQKPSGSDSKAQDSSESSSATTQSPSSAVPQNQFEQLIEDLKADNLRLKKELGNLKEEGLSQRFVKDSSSSIADKPAAMEVNQGLNISLIVSILAAIIALIIGCLIGKFLL